MSMPMTTPQQPPQDGGQTDTLTPARMRKRRNGQTMTEEQRETAMKLFLLHFRQYAIVSAACEYAGISRQTFYTWLKRKSFREQYEDAEACAQDLIRREIFRRGVEGWEEPVVSNGHIVYQREQVFDANGLPVLDQNGKPIYRQGPMLTVRKHSDAILQSLAKVRLPEYRQPDKHEIDMTTNGRPFRTVFIMPQLLNDGDPPDMLPAPPEPVVDIGEYPTTGRVVDEDPLGWPEPQPEPEPE